MRGQLAERDAQLAALRDEGLGDGDRGRVLAVLLELLRGCVAYPVFTVCLAIPNASVTGMHFGPHNAIVSLGLMSSYWYNGSVC